MKCIALTLAAALLRPLRPWPTTSPDVRAPHGGQLRMAGAYHIELVLARDARGGKPAPVKVYLSDHGGSKIAGGRQRQCGAAGARLVSSRCPGSGR